MEDQIIAAFSAPAPILARSYVESPRVRYVKQLRSLGYFDFAGYLDRRMYAEALGLADPEESLPVHVLHQKVQAEPQPQPKSDEPDGRGELDDRA